MATRSSDAESSSKFPFAAERLVIAVALAAAEKYKGQEIPYYPFCPFVSTVDQQARMCQKHAQRLFLSKVAAVRHMQSRAHRVSEYISRMYPTDAKARRGFWGPPSEI